MKNTDLTTANYDALKTYVLELRDRVMNKEYIKPIAESLAKRNDLTLFQKCSIMDLIAEQSEISFARHPALAAPKGMPLLVKGILGYRVGTDEANSGKIKNSIPAWCEEQKAIFKATPQPITVADTDRHPADSVPACEQSAPMIIDDEILKLLPDLYDLLVDDGVIKLTITKEDFLENIVKGVVPDMTPYSDHSWIKTIYKFKHTIKRIRPYFNNHWYNTVCSNAGLTADQMNKYNSSDAKTTGKRATYGTPTFDEKLNRIGIKIEKVHR